MTARHPRVWPVCAAALLVITAACSDDRSDTASAPSSKPAAPSATPIPPPAPPQSAPPPAAAEPAAPAPPDGAPAAPESAAAPASGSATAAAPAAAADGKVMYETYCTTCHGPLGKGDGPGAAALEPKPRDFTSGQFKFDPDGDGKTGEPEDLAEVVKNGAAKYGGSLNMVPWGPVLSEAQVQAVVQHVQSLSNP